MKIWQHTPPVPFHPRIRHRAITMACALLGLIGWAPAADLVKDGQPRAEILIAPTPARMTRRAAFDLQTYIEKISGARLTITNRPSADVPVKIYVGRSAGTEKLGLSTEGLAHGAFRIASGPDWLALLGADRDFEPMEPFGHTHRDKGRAAQDWDAAHPGAFYGFPYLRLGIGSHSPALDLWAQDDGGTLNAVCAFLRTLGVRWYFPGELGEVVPVRRSIALPAIDQHVTPDFPLRMFSFWRTNPDIRLWQRRLGCNVGADLIGTTQLCHGQKWIHLRDEIKQAHPEWYALVNGKRATDHSYSGAPCLSSQDLFERHLRFARLLFNRYNEPMLSLDVCDGYGGQMCRCPLCEGKETPKRGRDGSMSDYVFGYINRVAGELYRSHPDRKVSGLSYSTYKQPPEKLGQLSPNLALWLCQWRSDFSDPSVREQAEALRQAWLDVLPSRELYVYDYYLHSSSRYGYEGLPVYFPRLVAEDLRSLKGLSRGEQIEVYMHGDPDAFAGDPLAVMHLNIYATARLWWDAELDLDAMLDEFCTLFYGPAAAPMKAFLAHAETHWPVMRVQAEPIDQALRMLATAQQAVEPGSIHGQRVALVADYLKPITQLRDRLAKGRDDVPSARVLRVESLAGKTLDGRLDDEAYWRPVRTLSMYDLETGEPPKKGLWTSLRVFRAGDALYFGIHCAEPDMAGLNADAPAGETHARREGDFVEILLETATHSYYRIRVDPTGAIDDADCSGGIEEPRWSSGAQAAVHVGPDKWTVEVRVPLAGENARTIDPLRGVEGRMPSTLYPWYFNVGRQRVRDGIVERLAYSPTGTNRFDVTRRFAEMWSK